MKKALIIQQLDNGNLVVIEADGQHNILLSDLHAIVEPPGFEYPNAKNLYGVIREYFKPLPVPDPSVNPT